MSNLHALTFCIWAFFCGIMFQGWLQEREKFKETYKLWQQEYQDKLEKRGA